MDLALDITTASKVRILLVPVSPIKKTTFWKHVDIVKQFSSVRLGDVTPDLHKGANAKFSSQVFEEGQMHFQFVTTYNRDHCHLEDFQPHRRIFGVIGIMDCQEWEHQDLSEGYKAFADMLGQYPTAVATRCFAFDPTESQPDDTKGLIMIPNVGNMSFYMSTMICDFASEILDQFASIASRIESLTVLESPLPIGYIPRKYTLPAPVPTSSVSSSFLKRASTVNRPPATPKPSLSRSTTLSTISTNDAGRTFQRTPGRIKKLLADFYLLAGRLPDAIQHYQESIGMANVSFDYLWSSSAKEGLACAMILMNYLHHDIGHIVTRPVEEDPVPSKTVKKSIVTDITDMYEDVLTTYAKVNNTTSIPMPKLVYAEACLKISRFLTTVYVNGGWNEQALNKMVVNGSAKTKTTLDLAKCKNSGLHRYDIAQWVNKIWTLDMDELIMMDQMNIMTHMSSVLSTLGYHRKSAWTMYETLNRMIPLLISNVKKDHGLLQVLKRMCQVYGIGESHVQDGGTLTLFGKEETRKKMDFGWAALQIDILRQCIVISETIGDHASMLYYTTVLLKNLYQHITKEEQIRLASSIQRIVNISKRCVDNVNYWGFNIVKSICAVPPIPRKAIYQHPFLIAQALAASKDMKANSGDPFIYNPFAKKKNETPQLNLIQDEVCEFKVTLSNPFGFDLELSHIVLSTTGIAFSAVPTATTIPANDTLTIRLMGTPLETGALMIRGCRIKIVGFAEQEFLNEKPPLEKVIVVESERYKKTGLAAMSSFSNSEPAATAVQESFQVIEDQPLLKISSTSLLHGAIMLFEGEVQQISIQVENIGHIPVDFITLSFTDSTTLHPKPMNPELPTEEQYEIELYTKGTPVFSWEGSEGHSIGKRVNLPPGTRTEILVNIYGKQGCTSGSIHVDYGYLDRIIKDPTIQEELPTTLYTRQLYLPIMMTVYQNIHALNWDVLYLRDNTKVTAAQLKGVEALLAMTQVDDGDKNPYCLLLLDIRNTWTIPFDIEFKVDNSEDTESILTSTVTIQPGITKRMVLPLKKLFLTSDQRCQPVPSFEPNKQFVVSQAPKMAPEQERARLHMFWYREQLLSRVKAHWTCQQRRGSINLRPSLRLTALQLGILKKQDIEFIVDMPDHTVGHRQFQCKVNTFVEMNVTMVNRQSRPVKLILRVQPVQSYNDGAKEYDLTEKLLMQGVSQLVLPELPPGGEYTCTFPLCFLSRGRFEFLYHVQDVHTKDMYYDHDWAFVNVCDE